MNWSRRLFNTYQYLPGPLQTIARKSYNRFISGSHLLPNHKREFVTRFFDSEAEFNSYVDEFEQSRVTDRIESARREHYRRTGHGRFAAINQFTHARLYSLVRKRAPETIVETGVCNGVSTYVVLKALEENQSGRLYSVDYPDADRLPDDEQPGWIIPDALRDRWSLTEGKSQDVLPGMIEGLDSFDMFIHDTKAAIFSQELDIVWPVLNSGAIIIADDVHQADDFSRSATSKDVDYGYIAPNVGYMLKRS